MLSSDIPSCLADAYRMLNDDRAWVGCIVRENGVVTVGANAKVTHLLRRPEGIFASPTCPKEQRAAFLLAGLKRIEAEVLT